MKIKESFLLIAVILFISFCLVSCGPSVGGNPADDSIDSVTYTISASQISQALNDMYSHEYKKAVFVITDTAPDFVEIGKKFSSFFLDCDVTLDLQSCIGVSEVKDEAFYFCNASSIILPATIRSIGNYAFTSSSVTSLYIPAAVEYIHDLAFWHCLKLETLTVAQENSKYYSTEGVIFSTDNKEMFPPSGYKGSSITIPKEVTSIKGYKASDPISQCFRYMTLLENIYVEEGNKLYSSYSGALYNADKTKLYVCPVGKSNIELASTTTTLCDQSFWDCKKINTVLLPEGVRWIDNAVFVGCESLSELTIPSAVCKIGYMFLYQCEKCRILTMKPENPPDVAINSPFYNQVTRFTIKVPAVSVEKYKKWALDNKDYYISGDGKSKSDSNVSAQKWQDIHDAIAAE